MGRVFRYKDELLDMVEANLDRFRREMDDDRVITIRPGRDHAPGSETPEASAVARALLGGDGLDALRAEHIGDLEFDALEKGSKALYIFDQNGVIRYTNGAFDNLMGYPRGALQGKHLSILNFHSIEENARIMAGIIVHAHSRGFWKGPLSYRRRDDVLFSVPVYVQPHDVPGHRFWIAVHDERQVAPYDLSRFRKASIPSLLPRPRRGQAMPQRELAHTGA